MGIKMAIQDSFLLDEVRCGFMVPAAVKQAWAAELEVLMEIDRVCRKHNIQYYADWGTLLGTVRHGGFVPWDDDLDIVMKRADYDKFMTVARFDMEEGFDVQTFRSQKDFWLFMGKVVGKNRFCFEKEHLRRFHNFPYIACVDIFVLDYVYRDPEREEKRRILCKYMLGVADAIVEEKFAPDEKERSLKIIEEMSGRKLERLEEPVEMGRYLYGEVEKIFAEVPEQESDMLTQLFPWGLKGDFYHFPKVYYDHPMYLPFEGISMPVPMLYDKMLRKRYGDYLRLVKDAGAHNYPFFEGQKKNLRKVLDFELPGFRFDASKLYRTEEEKAYEKQSYKVMTDECVRELHKIKTQIFTAIESAQAEQTMHMIQTSQQLVVDLGTLLEQILGENSSIIHMLERYCEEWYGLYEQILKGDVESQESCIGNINALEDTWQLISEELEHNIFGRKTALFLPVLAKDWNGLHSMWQAACEDSAYDVYVVPLPYYYKDYDGSPRKVCCDAAEFPEELHVLDHKLLTSEYLEILHPEIIIIQNPYDAWNPAISVPEMYYSENIRKYTDQLIYIPPSALEEYTRESYREYFNMRYYVTVPGIVYADRIIVQSENIKQLYVEKLTEFAGEDTRAVWKQRIDAMGLPVMNAIGESEADAVEMSVCDSIECSVRRKKVLYGISLGTYMENPIAVQRKIERNLLVFAEYKDQIDLEIQIFPGDMESECRSSIMKFVTSHQELILRDGKKCPVKDYDAYYGDPMPLVTEFRQAGKPVMIQKHEFQY